MNSSIIPAWREDGQLPNGIYWASKEEINERFGFNDHRRRLLTGFWAAAKVFQKVGVTEVLINGSFVTRKEKPGDIDACWSLEGADLVQLRSIEPVLLDFSNHRARQKAKFWL